jgi:cytochrome c biogenesis protein CcmG/thiol:disulfide interchange protein DsbE
MKKIVLTLVGAVVLILLCLGWAAAGEKLSQAPNFTLPDMNGKKVELKSLLGKGPVFIHFWATWCKPCLEELPYLDKMGQTYKDKGLAMVAISIDDPKTVNKVKSLIKTRRYKFLVLLDTAQEVSNLYHVQDVMPTDILLDAKGMIRHTHTGYKPGDEVTLEKEIAKLLDEAKP